jgi:hypothetical protein
VPVETIVVVVVVVVVPLLFSPPDIVVVDRKRVKMPLPLGVPLEFTDPLPSSNSQSPPPLLVDCRSTTTRLNVSLVGGGVVEGLLTVSVTGSVTELFETAEEVNVTWPL